MQDQVIEVVRKYRSRIMDNNIFFKPNIPDKKLNNVISSYAQGIRPSQGLVLIDNTVFGNAKDGALLTPTTLFAHNITENPYRVELAGIRTVGFVEGMTSVLLINDRRFLDTNLPEKYNMHLFVEMLREIVELFHPKSTGESPLDALRKLKELLDAGILTQAEFDQKKQEYLKRL